MRLLQSLTLLLVIILTETRRNVAKSSPLLDLAVQTGNFKDWLSSITADATSNILRKKVESSDDLSLLAGKRILITGCASGIGLSLARRIHSAVDMLFVQCRPEKIKSLKNMLSTPRGSLVNLRFLGIDLNNLEDFPDALESYKIGPLDILISNAGSMHSGVVNCAAPFALVLLLLPECLLAKNPKIIFISSSSHIRGGPYKPGSVKSLESHVNGVKGCLKSYAISKYNSLLLSAALDRRLRDTGIVIQNIHPGLVDTPMLRVFFSPNKLFDPLLRRALLSSSECACSVLRAIVHTKQSTLKANAGEKYQFLENFYCVGFEPALKRMSIHIRKDHQQHQAEMCFSEMLGALPVRVRMEVIKKLRSYSYDDSRASRLSVSILSNRKLALLKLAEEIEGQPRS